MWEISSGLQLIAVIKAALLGGVFCLLYDVLRALRKHGFNSSFAVFVQDLIYFIIMAPVTFCFLLALTNGELRGYFFLALVIGFFVTRFTISIVFLKVVFYIIFSVLWFLGIINKSVNYIFNVIYKFLRIISIFINKKFLKISKCFKKLLKKRG